MEWLISWLQKQQRSGLFRQLRPVQRLGGGQLKALNQPDLPPLFDFSSNDYLALTEHPKLIEASRNALEQFGTGSGAARLMSGDLEIFHTLEDKVAQLKGKEAGLIFGSGYLANTGIIPALVGRGDVLFVDRLNHASIYDGCRLSGAGLKRFHHNDLNHLESLLQKERGAGRALIVVESVYSMDGDICPLRDLVELKNRYDCLLLVDEAHATGIFGPNGGGMIEEMGVADQVDLAMGTFGKALGSYGAYVASDRQMISYLINRARSFIFSTALPPAVAAASLAAVELIRQEPELRRDLAAKVAVFKDALRNGGLTTDLGPTQIVPVHIGKSHDALEIARQLTAANIFATAVRPPTVPENSARIRFSITRHLEKADLQRAAGSILNLLHSS